MSTITILFLLICVIFLGWSVWTEDNRKYAWALASGTFAFLWEYADMLGKWFDS